MEFIITDRDTIETGLLVQTSYVVISIRDPHKRPANVRKQAGLRDVLFLSFHDAEPTHMMALSGKIKLMMPIHAKQIHQFVDKHKEHIGAIVVHCEQGMSRSPAVAAALCKSMGGDDKNFWRDYQPNRYVYRLVLEAADGRVG